MQTSLSHHAQLKVLELRRQDSLDILRVCGGDGLAAHLTDAESQHIAVFAVTHFLESTLRHFRDLFGFIGLERLEEIGDTQRVFAGIERDRSTAQLAGFGGMADGFNQRVQQPQDESRGCHGEKQRGRHGWFKGDSWGDALC